MKPLLLIPTLLASCASYKSDPTTGSFSVTTFGTDADAISATKDSFVVIKQNQSKVAMSAIRTTGTIASTYLVNDMLKFVRGQEASEVIGAQKADVAKEGMREATKQTQIKADAATEALRITESLP